MQVLIVGLNHQIQPVEIRSLGEELVELERQQKENFGQALQRIVKERGVQFVGEEAEHGIGTIAEQVAQRPGCHYANIDMRPDQRQARGIPADYTCEESPYSAEDKARWDRERERYMFEQANAQVGDAENVLVLCGRRHTNALAQLFQQAGHTVEPSYDLNQESWYVENWLEHILGME